jgi:hypothetical protein
VRESPARGRSLRRRRSASSITGSEFPPLLSSPHSVRGIEQMYWRPRGDSASLMPNSFRMESDSNQRRTVRAGAMELRVRLSASRTVRDSNSPMKGWLSVRPTRGAADQRSRRHRAAGRGAHVRHVDAVCVGVDGHVIGWPASRVRVGGRLSCGDTGEILGPTGAAVTAAGRQRERGDEVDGDQSCEPEATQVHS